MDEEAHLPPLIHISHISIQEPNIKATRYLMILFNIFERISLEVMWKLNVSVTLLLQEAQQRLEETHREKVTRVMKDWSDLEEKYQDMRLADPKAAQSFKQRMTARFQVH